ncbi:MAG TPA: hypothetical protein VGH51_16180 [Candidatus Angelobacter sp.]
MYADRQEGPYNAAEGGCGPQMFLKSSFELAIREGGFLFSAIRAFGIQHSAKANPCLNRRQSAGTNRKQLAISHWQLAEFSVFGTWLLVFGENPRHQ